MGGGFSMGKSESSQQSNSWQNVWQQQIPYLESLYKTGTDVIGKMVNERSQYEQPALEAWKSMLTGGGENPMLAEQIRTAQSRAGEGFAENILPAIQSSAIDAGGLGGTRGGIAAGMAGREATREQGRIAESMQFNDYGQQQARILQALGMSGGLNSLSQSSLQPLLALAQILGRPTALSGSHGEGSAEAWNLAMQGSMTGMS